MKKLLDLFSDPKNLALTLGLASLGTLTFVYISQYVFHYDPCILCLYQRKPYFAVLALAAAAFFAEPKIRFYLLLLCGAAFLAGTGIAGYHNGVEQEWWAGTQACGDASLPQNASIEELKEYLMNKKIVRCDVPSWKFLGLSMTAYNLMLSLGLSAFTFYFALQGRKKNA